MHRLRFVSLAAILLCATVSGAEADPSPRPVENLYEMLAVADGVVELGTQAAWGSQETRAGGWGRPRFAGDGYRVLPALGARVGLRLRLLPEARALWIVGRAPSGGCRAHVAVDGKRVGSVDFDAVLRGHRVPLSPGKRRPRRAPAKGRSLVLWLKGCAPASDGSRLELHSIRVAELGAGSDTLDAPPAPRAPGREVWLRAGEKLRVPVWVPAGGELVVPEVMVSPAEPRIVGSRSRGTPERNATRPDDLGETSARIDLALLRRDGSREKLAELTPGAAAFRKALGAGEAAELVEIDLEVKGVEPGWRGWVGLRGARVEARLGATVPAAVPDPAAARTPRLVILHIIDSVRADHLEAYVHGAPVRTPNLSRLAREGALFENASAQGCWSKSSAASIFTGLYAYNHKGHRHKDKLPRWIQLIQQRFHKGGWSTAAFFANGYVDKRFGYKRGWTRYRNYIVEGGPTRGKGVLERARRWISKHRGEPAFVAIFTVDPHLPYRPPREFWKPYYGLRARPRINPNNTGALADAWQKHGRMPSRKADWAFYRALYQGEIAYSDHYLGGFLDWLGEQGLAQNTLYVLTSDHGEEFKDHDSVGHGHTLYQELLHVPLIFRWPDGLPAGRRVRTPVESIDLAPTLLDLSGLPPYPKYQGESLAPLLRGAEARVPLPVFAEMGGIATSIWRPPFKMIRFYRWSRKTWLFDLQQDPGEQEERFAKDPLAARYVQRLLAIFEGGKVRWHKVEDGRVGDFSRFLAAPAERGSRR